MCGLGIGGALCQEGRSVTFYNEKLNETRQKWLTCEQELYVVIHALKICRTLSPKEIVIYS